MNIAGGWFFYPLVIFIIMNHQNIYNKLIERAKNRVLEGYTETHHIIPKCLGGEDTEDNLVNLTAREHFLCHKLLCEIYPDNHKLLWALWLMAIGKKKWKHRDPYKVTGREYERLKVKFIESRKKPITESHKNKIGKSNSKKVLQYDFSGNLIQKFSSAMEAERFINNKPNAHWSELRNNINDCCRLKQKSAYNYIWKYEGDLLDLSQHKGSLNKKNGKRNPRTKTINS